MSFLMEQDLKSNRMLDVGEAGCGAVVDISLVLQNMVQGEVLEIRTTDITMEGELSAWVRLCGHDYLGSIMEGLTLLFFVRKGISE